MTANRSPSSATVPKVKAAAAGAPIGVVFGALVLVILRHLGITLEADEQSVVQAAVEWIVMVGFPALFAWGFGYMTPPRGFAREPKSDPADTGDQGGMPPTVLAIAIVALLLAGCAQMQQGMDAIGGTMTPEMRAVMICRSYDATLRSLAGYRAAGKLSTADVEAVETLRMVANPICLAPTPPVGVELTVALDALETEMQRALMIEQRAGKE